DGGVAPSGPADDAAGEGHTAPGVGLPVQGCDLSGVEASLDARVDAVPGELAGDAAGSDQPAEAGIRGRLQATARLHVPCVAARRDGAAEGLADDPAREPRQPESRGLDGGAVATALD